MKEDIEHRFTWLSTPVSCQECSHFYSLGFPSQSDDEKFRGVLKSGRPFRFVESVESYFLKPRFSLLGFGIGGGYVQGGEVYSCISCGQKWAYSDADYAWRGYFKPITGIKQKIGAAE